MKIPPALPALLTAALLAGCASQSREQIAAARAAGISSGLVYKLEHWRALSVEDLVELHRRRVDDAVALRQINLAGVEFTAGKDELRQLRKSGVSSTVITAAVTASSEYEHRFYGGWYGPCLLYTSDAADE